MTFENTPDFTFFHTQQWRDALLRAFPAWRDVSQTIALPDGRMVYLPLLQTRQIAWWRWLEAMPFGFFGGPLVETGTLNRAEIGYLLRKIGRGAGWLAFNLDPCGTLSKAEFIPYGAAALQTHLLALDDGFEAAAGRFSKMVQRHIRAAQRAGVQARRGYGLADFRAYYALSQISARRWGMAQPPFPPALYNALAELPPEHVKLWLAEFEGKTIGGLIAVRYTPERVLYWGSALDDAYARLNPTKLLQYALIREVCADGALIYNMGPSEGFDGAALEGVRQAKEALGARPYAYHIVIVMNRWAMRASALGGRLRRS